MAGNAKRFTSEHLAGKPVTGWEGSPRYVRLTRTVPDVVTSRWVVATGA